MLENIRRRLERLEAKVRPEEKLGVAPWALKRVKGIHRYQEFNGSFYFRKSKSAQARGPVKINASYGSLNDQIMAEAKEMTLKYKTEWAYAVALKKIYKRYG
jgi:hypothetical protein